jgi:hypothetical protein
MTRLLCVGLPLHFRDLDEGNRSMCPMERSRSSKNRRRGEALGGRNRDTSVGSKSCFHIIEAM